MIKQIENLSDNIPGFEFSGEVSANDYEKVIFPAIEKRSKLKSKIRIICHFTDKTTISLEAMWDDTLVGIKHCFNWEKIAVVSDIAWLNHTFKAMGFLMQGHLRTYSNNEIQKAMIWLKEN
ncbi:MAG TPA: STAS/SEC14 domain-containing protein [Hanamia sp.]|nr:STAS/SEC14 domain-containing protein [Hanamia sp.]